MKLICHDCKHPIKARQTRYRIHRDTDKLYKYHFICGTCYWSRKHVILEE